MQEDRTPEQGCLASTEEVAADIGTTAPSVEVLSSPSSIQQSVSSKALMDSTDANANDLPNPPEPVLSTSPDIEKSSALPFSSKERYDSSIYQIPLSQQKGKKFGSFSKQDVYHIFLSIIQFLRLL